MQIRLKKNANFEKPNRNQSKRTKVKILKKYFFWISHAHAYLMVRLAAMAKGNKVIFVNF